MCSPKVSGTCCTPVTGDHPVTRSAPERSQNTADGAGSEGQVQTRPGLGLSGRPSFHGKKGWLVG